MLPKVMKITSSKGCALVYRPCRVASVVGPILPPQIAYHGSMLCEGTHAPNFTGITDSGDDFRLTDWQGRKHVVLYFYVRDFTRG